MRLDEISIDNFAERMINGERSDRFDFLQVDLIAIGFEKRLEFAVQNRACSAGILREAFRDGHQLVVTCRTTMFSD